MYDSRVDADLPDRISRAEGLNLPLLMVRCVDSQLNYGLTCPLPFSRAVDGRPQSSRT